MKNDKFTILTIVLVLIAGIVAIYAVLSLAWGIMKETVGGFAENIVSIAGPKREIDYNFEIKAQENSYDEQKSEPTKSEKNDIEINSEKIAKASRLLNEGEEINYSFSIPKRKGEEDGEIPGLDDILKDAQAAELNNAANNPYTANIPQTNIKIQIPKIGIEAPVWQGKGAEQLLEQGWWIYPASGAIGHGEVAMLCHRRHFGTADPRTCWFLDQVAPGDKIYMNFADSNLVYEYEIVGSNVFEANDPQIYNLSQDEDAIRIVTCTPLYSNTHRLVVLAKRVK